MEAFSPSNLTTLTDLDRQAAQAAIIGVTFGEVTTPDYDLLVRLHDLARVGSSQEANDLFQQSCRVWPKDMFSDEALSGYIDQRPRDAAGLVPGYDAIAGMFRHARVLLTIE